jgi:hypothetical protein
MIGGNSIKIRGKMFENCMEGYIMVAQKGGRSQFGAQEEKEVEGSC